MTSHIKLNASVNAVTGVVSARPSRVIKTPYVCDLMIMTDEHNQDPTAVIAHTPSLGCNGMVDTGATVVAVERKDTKGKCAYGVIASIQKERECDSKSHIDHHTVVVGVDPSLAERFAGDILHMGVIPGLKVHHNVPLQTQKTYEDCRFDYCGVTSDSHPFICEVKNVSIARYEDLHPKLLAKKDCSDRAIDSKIALFPSGYKPKGLTHSERALKHTQTLTKIKKEYPDIRCIIMFVVQRDDVITFKATDGDEQYRNALKTAHENGVEVYAVCVKWTYDEDAKLLTPRVHETRPLLPVDL